MKLSDLKIVLWICIAVVCSVYGSVVLVHTEEYFYVGQQLEEEVFLIIIASFARYCQFNVSAIVAESLLILSFGKLYDILKHSCKLPQEGDYLFFILMFLWVIGRICLLKYKKRKMSRRIRA